MKCDFRCRIAERPSNTGSAELRDEAIGTLVMDRGIHQAVGRPVYLAVGDAQLRVPLPIRGGIQGELFLENLARKRAIERNLNRLAEDAKDSFQSDSTSVCRDCPDCTTRWPHS
jgi:hypothetical protein